MTHRENILAILHGQDYEAMPIVSFGYWRETLQNGQLKATSPRKKPTATPKKATTVHGTGL